MQPQLTRLLIRTSSDSRDASSSDQIKIPGKENLSIVQTLPSPANAWDDAHDLVAENPDIVFAEPEINSSEVFYSYQQEVTERSSAPIDPLEYINYWPHPDKTSFWHLGDNYSQLKKAKDEIAGIQTKRTIRIAHLDTGYTAAHLSTNVAIIRKDLERNFVEDEQDRWNDAEDPFATGTLKMPGHGTGTLSILAGAKMEFPAFDFSDYIGVYDKVEIVPIRISKTVVLLKSGAFVKALDYIVNELYENDSTRVHVVTMSMGGLASAAWADLVNMAYEKGIFIVTAAGNNFNKLPARTMIFPARFRRVVAACGVTYDRSPYAKTKGDASFSIMEGNYGPKALMDTAIAAFTPNVPWASYTKKEVVSVRGDGTSSATPQIASAAALYYVKYYDELMALPQGWMRVEAIRHALFSSAKKQVTEHDGDYAKYFGNGILQAADALQVPVPAASELHKQKEDKVSFPFLKVVFGIRSADDENYREEEMLEAELMQLVLMDPQLQDILKEEEVAVEELSSQQQVRIAEVVIENPHASMALKEKMQLVVNRGL